jgi:methionyl-tRNA synthetase
MSSSCAEILSRLGVDQAALGSGGLDAVVSFHTSGERQLARKDAMWPRLEAVAASVNDEESSVTDQPIQPSGATPPAPVAPATPPAATTTSSPGPPSDAERLSIDDSMKIDLRVARILAAERVPKSKKLMKLSVDLGTEQRTVVAGIAEAYEADALVGRHVVVVANLKAAKLMGIESNGMVLAASPDGGQPNLLAFDQVPAPGTRVR